MTVNEQEKQGVEQTDDRSPDSFMDEVVPRINRQENNRLGNYSLEAAVYRERRRSHARRQVFPNNSPDSSQNQLFFLFLILIDLINDCRSLQGNEIKETRKIQRLLCSKCLLSKN